MPPVFKELLNTCLSSIYAYPENRFSGNGIVICAGGPELFTNAYVLIHILRIDHNCMLPIEVWHYGSAEMSPRMKTILRELDVDTIDVEGVMAAFPAAIKSGWQLKTYALMWSRFDQVLMLDADQVPLRDPTYLFASEDYRKTGALLWPDVNDILAINPIWDACSLSSRTLPAIESGQLLIHKKHHWAALQIALHLNEQSDYYYGFIYGDKDTYLIALLITGEKYTLLPHRPIADVSFCLYQRDFEGRPLFQHRTGSKWRYSGSQRELPGFLLFDECMIALARLNLGWNGLVFQPPSRSYIARNLEIKLVENNQFDFVEPGHAAVVLEFLPDGEIGGGRAADRMNWHCEEIESEIELLISDAFCPVWRFKRDANGKWIGRHELGQRAAFLAQRSPAHEFRCALEQRLAEDILFASGFPSPAWIDSIDDLSRAFRLVAAVQPGIGAGLAAVAKSDKPLTTAQRNQLLAIAGNLKPIPRRIDAKSNWPGSRSYTNDPEIDLS